MSPLDDLEKPLPRARNAAATKAAILDAARARFSREGYEEVGLRDLARDAGVDAAMVCRYFGSKEDLFAEALRLCEGGESLTQYDRAEFGRQIAHELIYEPDECDKLTGLLIMLRSSGSAKASEIVQRAIERDFTGPFQAWLGGEQAQARARLASSLIMGVALSRTLSGPLADEAEKAAMAERLAVMLQAVVDG